MSDKKYLKLLFKVKKLEKRLEALESQPVGRPKPGYRPVQQQVIDILDKLIPNVGDTVHSSEVVDEVSSAGITMQTARKAQRGIVKVYHSTKLGGWTWERTAK